MVVCFVPTRLTHANTCILQTNTNVLVRIASSDEHAMGLAIYVRPSVRQMSNCVIVTLTLYGKMIQPPYLRWWIKAKSWRGLGKNMENVICLHRGKKFIFFTSREIFWAKMRRAPPAWAGPPAGGSKLTEPCVLKQMNTTTCWALHSSIHDDAAATTSQSQVYLVPMRAWFQPFCLVANHGSSACDARWISFWRFGD